MEIEKAFKRLLIKSPFYGLFCLSLPKSLSTEIDTLAVARKGVTCELLINEEFWNQNSDDEQIALLQHELSHICLQHMLMSNSFSDPRLFNLAADLEVNSYIENLPSCACTADKFQLPTGQGTKFYYEKLQQQQQANAQNPQMPCNGGQGGNNGSGQSQAGDGEQSPYPQMANGMMPIDDHGKWKGFDNLPEATRQLIKNNIDSILKQTAEQVEKQCGSIPGEFADIISKLREKKPELFNWKGYFRRLLGSIYDVNIRSTRRKQSKRFEGAAGIQHKKKVSMLVAIDTSGSVSEKELQEFFSEIDYIHKAGAKVTIVECDSRIGNIVEYDGKNIPKITGRGGTDFNPPIKYYIKNKKDYASLVYFTDGYASLPSDRPSGVVWIISSGGNVQDYPGKTVYIPKEY